MPLITELNLKEHGKTYFQSYSPADDFYEALINAHRDLSDEESEQLNARLILLLSNHIGDLTLLKEALEIARTGLSNQASQPSEPSTLTE